MVVNNIPQGWNALKLRVSTALTSELYGNAKIHDEKQIAGYVQKFRCSSLWFATVDEIAQGHKREPCD